MSNSNNNLIPNGTAINLKHFIYLDRPRLTSYASQLSDGIVQSRKLTENVVNRSVDSPLELYEEEIVEKGNEAEFSIGPKTHIGGLTNKKNNKIITRTGFKNSGTIITDESSQSFSEDKINHDNSYLYIEEKLIEKNILCEVNNFSQLNSYSPLIKIKGTARFFDWETIRELLSNPNEFHSYLNKVYIKIDKNRNLTQDLGSEYFQEPNLAVNIY